MSRDFLSIRLLFDAYIICEKEDGAFRKAIDNKCDELFEYGGSVYIGVEQTGLFSYDDLFIKINAPGNNIEKIYEIKEFIEYYISSHPESRYYSTSSRKLSIECGDKIAFEFQFSNKWFNNKTNSDNSYESDLNHLFIVNFNGNLDDLRVFKDVKEIYVEQIDRLNIDADFSEFKNLKYLTICMLDSNLSANKEIINRIKSTLPKECTFECIDYSYENI